LNSHLGEKCIEQTSGVVTIDELDLHLHPAWQRTIISSSWLRTHPSFCKRRKRLAW
jgi:predicted ATP-binding protein involved in virulence